VAAHALPAFAAGESTDATLQLPVVDKTFTWDYTFSQGDGHALSNIAIAFCSPALLADVASTSGGTIFTSGDVEGGHGGFGPGIKFPLTAGTGTFSVTFKSDHAVVTDAVKIQSHSGDGQDPDATNLIDGPGCPTENPGGDNTGGNTGGDNTGGNTGGDNTGGNTGGDNTGRDDNGGTNNGGDNNTGGSNNGGDNNTGGQDANVSPEDISDPAPVTTTAGTPSGPTAGTTVLGETFDNSDPAPAPAVAPTAAPSNVAGENVQAGSELPRTGSAHFQFLVSLGLALLAAGVALQAAFRRNRSAAFPG
jgi:LPXTG-motif cell wall-anchored protein